MLRTLYSTSSLRRCFPLFHRRAARINLGHRLSSNVPTFRELTRLKEVEPFGERVKRPSIRKQVLFTLFGSFVVFDCAAYYTDLDTLRWTVHLSSNNPMHQMREPTSDDIKRAKYFSLGKTLQAGLLDLKTSLADFPIALRELILVGFARSAQQWLDASDARRTCWLIIGVNTLVFLAWKVPRLKPVMSTRFTHYALSGRAYTLLTSTFSHESIFHLAFNCMALASFGSAAAQYLVREQRNSPSSMRESTPAYHLLAFFVSAGLFSGLVSHIVAVRIRFPRLISRLSAQNSNRAAVTTAGAAADGNIRPGLGSSGAIYAAVMLTALAFPEAELSLYFPPFFPIPIQWGAGAMVLLDVIGIIRGWRYIDHWTHLGGAAFGVLYYAYGLQWWEGIRKWHLKTLPDPEEYRAKIERRRRESSEEEKKV